MVNNDKKIMIVSSSGGHFAQIRYLVDRVAPRAVLILNESVNYPLNCKMHKIIHTNNYLIMLVHFFEASYYILKYRPKTIISPGAAPGAIFGLVGKLMGVDYVFIESFSRVSSPSLAGRFSSLFCDAYVCQHEPVAFKVAKSTMINTIVPL